MACGGAGAALGGRVSGAAGSLRGPGGRPARLGGRGVFSIGGGQGRPRGGVSARRAALPVSVPGSFPAAWLCLPLELC